MGKNLYGFGRRFELREPATHEPARNPSLSFQDAAVGAHFLDGIDAGIFNRAALREMLAGELPAATIRRMSDAEVQAQVAWRLAHRSFHVVEEPYWQIGGVPGGGGQPPAPAPPVQETPPAAPPPAEKAAVNWITFQLLDDATGLPVAGVGLTLKLPDGTTARYTTNTDGLVHLAGLPAGTCDLVEISDDEALEVVEIT